MLKTVICTNSRLLYVRALHILENPSNKQLVARKVKWNGIKYTTAIYRMHKLLHINSNYKLLNAYLKKNSMENYYQIKTAVFTLKASLIGVPIFVTNHNRVWSCRPYNDMLYIPPREVST